MPTANSQQPTANSQQPTANLADLGFSADALAQRKAELLNTLRQTAPELIADNQLNLEALKDLLGEETLAKPEHYELNWAGKSAARREIQRTTSHTLKPAANNPEHAQHMLIEGENLEVLRVLQKSYYGKVKMIYIDPPYNTGNDSFVYPDDYSETLDEYQKRTGEKSEDGFLNKQSLWKKNTKESGQYHSAWLSMMYPRLYLARNLLRDDGVIFISIDDNEQANLRLLCDEVFGEENLIGVIEWNSTKSVTNTALISVGHTHNLIYARNKQYFVDNRVHFRIPESGDGFSNPDNDPRGPWKADPFQVGGERPDQLYEIINPKTKEIYTPNPGNSWKNAKAKFDQLFADGRIVFGVSGDAGPQRKRFLTEALERGKVPKTWWDDVDTTTNGTTQLKGLLGGNYFTNPKPVKLIHNFLLLGDYTRTGIILDFFAGSGTTAHAVMELNAEDGGNRQSISVQLPELLDGKSEAYKAGYRTIADITRARINKVIEKLKAEQPDKTQDLACANFTLAPSNFKVWQTDLTDIEAVRKQLEMFQQAEKLDSDVHQNDEKNQTAMLTELLLKQGLGALGVHAVSRPKQLACGITIHRVLMADDNQLWLCFEPYQEALKEEIIKAKPAQVILLNSCFASTAADEQLSNLKLELDHLNIDLLVI